MKTIHIEHSGISTVRKVLCLTFFSIAMGFLEAAVVVYLRQIYYPDGFSFPMKIIALQGLSIEFCREISTIVMLVTVSLIAGTKFYERLAYFLYCFGIWDIFYYFWLKIMLDWPPSLFTWDVLFLIPVVWIGPVLAPLICAVTMILFALSIIWLQQKEISVKLTLSEFVLLSSGALIIFITFILDYAKLIIQGGFVSRISALTRDPEFQQIISGYIPSSYNWLLFSAGEGLMLCVFVMFFYRNIRL